MASRLPTAFDLGGDQSSTPDMMPPHFCTRPACASAVPVVKCQLYPHIIEINAAARRGSREAAGTLVTRHLRACRAVALAVTNDVDAADDICQDAMIRAIEELDRCRDPARFGAWVRQITRNVARNDRRRAGFLRLEPVRDRGQSPSVQSQGLRVRAPANTAFAGRSGPEG